MSGGGSIKNPNHEAERPAPMPIDGEKPLVPVGENTQGNDRDELDQDPEGQQSSAKR